MRSRVIVFAVGSLLLGFVSADAQENSTIAPQKAGLFASAPSVKSPLTPQCEVNQSKASSGTTPVSFDKAAAPTCGCSLDACLGQPLGSSCLTSSGLGGHSARAALILQPVYSA